MNEYQLNCSRNHLLKQLFSLAENMPEIQGIFLGGSLAVNQADAYSDIDFRVVINRTIDKTLIIERFLQQLPSLLFIETQTTFYAVIHFDSFIKLDLFVYYQEELLPSSWLASIAIYQDYNEQLARIKQQSRELHYCPSQEEVDFFLTKYYAFLHEYYRRWKRGEMSYSLSCQLTMKHCLISFWYMEKRLVPNSLGDWSKYEGARTKLSDNQIAQLEQLSEMSGIPFIQIISELIKEVLQQLTKIYPINFRVSHYDKVISLVTK